jgi:SAM-dependent methyltransferase
MIDRARPLAGERWLDIASGVGDPAALLLDELSPEGTVVLSDLAHGMASTASAALGGRAPAVTAAAEALPFRSAFDGVTCRFGAMFFADPPRAFDEIRSVLEPSGRAVFVVWGERERNPFFAEVAEAVREAVPDAPVPEPDDPQPFRYAPAGKLATLLRSGGWSDVEDQTLRFESAGPIPHAEFWDFMLSMGAELEKLVRELPDDARAALRSSVESRVAPYFSNGGCRFPAEARLVFARRPASG